MGTKTVLLVRHGETVWNAERRYQGRTDVPLSPTGEEQARRLGARLAQWHPQAIYSSALGRAARTGELIAGAAASGPAVAMIPGLEELDFGEWEGLTADEITRRYGEMHGRWKRDPSSVRAPGGESFEEAVRRVGKAIAPLLSSAEGRIVLVGHGGSIRAALVSLIGFRPSQVWHMRLDNCSITAVEESPCSWRLCFWNDRLHTLVPGSRAHELPIPQ
ncbi:MAG: histidine phosphatase family protein [Synergistales bacterium]|nr:histidine phosphatase family protein [Synergistales bacterium]